MIRIRSLTQDEKRQLRTERRSSWHKWFAWHPVRLTHDENEVRWLGVVFRKGRRYWSEDGEYWLWKYAETELDISKEEKN